MSDLASFRAIIELWPSREVMASDIGARSSAVSKWWQRDGIPSEWWEALLSTEKARTFGLTADLLTRLVSRVKEETRA